MHFGLVIYENSEIIVNSEEMGKQMITYLVFSKSLSLKDWQLGKICMM